MTLWGDRVLSRGLINRIDKGRPRRSRGIRRDDQEAAGGDQEGCGKIEKDTGLCMQLNNTSKFNLGIWWSEFKINSIRFGVTFSRHQLSVKMKYEFFCTPELISSYESCCYFFPCLTYDFNVLISPHYFRLRLNSTMDFSIRFLSIRDYHPYRTSQSLFAPRLNMDELQVLKVECPTRGWR